MIAEQERSKILLKFEEIKGISSDSFDTRTWEDFEYFCIGYNTAHNEHIDIWVGVLTNKD